MKKGEESMRNFIVSLVNLKMMIWAWLLLLLAKVLMAYLLKAGAGIKLPFN